MLFLIAAGIFALGAVVGSGQNEREGSSQAGAALPAACTGSQPADVRRLAGSMLVVRSTGEPDRALVRRARAGEIGGIILFPPAELPEDRLTSTISELQRAAAAGGLPPLVIAIDQEGGPVKRLPLAPPQRAPVDLAELGAAEARREGVATGEHLRGLGINVDLAPVLDVPAGPTSIVGGRAFGTDPERVAELGLAFADGLRDEGVAATAKHFPGLGRATVNTDLAPATIAATRSQLRADLAPFEAGVEANVPLVMASAAAYPELGARGPAVFSREIVTELLRERLGYEGVVITDDLGAGADLLLFATDRGEGVLEALTATERSGRLELEMLRESCARTFSLRDELVAPR